jgi:hypothetical protein
MLMELVEEAGGGASGKGACFRRSGIPWLNYETILIPAGKAGFITSDATKSILALLRTSPRIPP